MLGPPDSALAAGLEALVVAALLLGLGYLIADALIGSRNLDEVERWGLALAGICGFALVAMLVHMAGSGWLFANPVIVRIAMIVTGGILLVRRWVRRGGRNGKHLGIAAGLVVASVVIWGSPVARMMPLTATADTQLHNGWIDQLMAGDTTFGAVLTGDVPNYYPWLFHSMGAITTTITPGQTPYHALAPLQLLQVAGSVLALFALGRALTGRASTGYGAALLGALSGGFGFVLLRGLDVVTDPRAQDGAAALRYQGDLLFSRSYNIGFHNLAPPFPRDLAFALLISFVLLLAVRARNAGGWIEAAAGCCLGLVGLTGGETFIVGVVLAAVVALTDGHQRTQPASTSRNLAVSARIHQLRVFRGSAVRMLGPALLLYAIWFVPIVANYIDLGGFVSITHIIPVALPATAILVSWGLATPLALIGMTLRGRRWATDRRVKLCWLFALTAGGLLIVSAVIPEVLGDAFDTLGRKHRYWPIFYLPVALLGAIGFTSLMDLLRRRSEAVAAGALILLTAVAWASPVVASVALPTHIGRYPEIEAAMRHDEESLLARLRDLGPGCAVAAPQEIAREVFSYTGFRLVLWTGNWFGPNRARIRWTDIYDRIGAEDERITANKALISGDTERAGWERLADRYGVDVVISPDEGAERSDAFEGREMSRALHGERPYTIVVVRDCRS